MMTKKITRYVFFVLAVVIAIAAIVGYRIWNKPHQNIKDADAIGTTAVELYTDLANNGNHKSLTLINKVVVVSGEVKEISKNQQNQQIVLLKTGINGGSVNCTMEERAHNIRTGDMVLIKGICIGYIGGDKDMDLPGDVFLIRCYQSI